MVLDFPAKLANGDADAHQDASAKPAEKACKLYHDKELHLLVRSNGSKLRRMRYRFRDKQNELHFEP